MGSKPIANAPQQRYVERAKADKQLQVLSVPDLVIADASAAGVFVGKGSLLRIKGVTGEHIIFGSDTSIGIVAGTEDTSVETPADFFSIIATDDFIRTSVAMRIEVNSED